MLLEKQEAPTACGSTSADSGNMYIPCIRHENRSTDILHVIPWRLAQTQALADGIVWARARATAILTPYPGLIPGRRDPASAAL